MLHMFISHTSLSSGKGRRLRVETALVMLIPFKNGNRAASTWRAMESGVCWEGVQFRVRDFLLPSGARLWVGSTGPEDADQLDFVCLIFISVLSLWDLDFKIKAPFSGCFRPVI